MLSKIIKKIDIKYLYNSKNNISISILITLAWHGMFNKPRSRDLSIRPVLRYNVSNK